MSHRNTTVTTNSFRISRLPSIPYIQYDVVIHPEVEIPRRRKELILHMQNTTHPNLFQPRAIYDGKKILYSPAQLRLPGGNTGTLEVALGTGERDQYRVTLSFSSTIGFADLERLMAGQSVDASVAINLLQMLLRQAPSLLYPTKGRSVFSDAGLFELGSGIVMLRGYFQSVRVVPGSATVNVDVANACFYKPGPLSRVAVDVLGTRNSRDLSLTPRSNNYDKTHSTLKRFFNRLRIKVPKVSNKIRTIHGIEPNAGHYQFEKEPGVFMTVEEYYYTTYNIKLQAPQDFGVILTPAKHQPKTIVPFELCVVVPGQVYTKRLSPFQTADMVKATTQKPADRLQRIRAAVGGQQNNILQYGNSDFLAAAGISIVPEPMDVTGRILGAPPITYGANSTSRVDGGKWNMLGKKLFKPAAITEWCILNLSVLGQDQAQIFVKQLLDCCQAVGMTARAWPPKLSYGGFNSASFQSYQDIETAVRQTHRGKPQLVLVILNKSDPDTKTKVKQFGDIMSNVITQCVREDKFSRNLGPNQARNLNQYCNNVALKINARLGGINCMTPLPGLSSGQGIFMIMGADVSHPPGGAMIDRPSVASLVYSVDRYGCQYQAQHSVLPPRTEVMGDELTTMVKNATIAFTMRNTPFSKLIFYRDGVSEGEFETVANKEVEAITTGINQGFDHCVGVLKEQGKPVSKPKLPTITFLVVTKRHHVRFFPKDNNDADRSTNLKAGFATDTSMCTPGLNEFYLLSHTGLLGTSRPSHYIILKDDNFNGNRQLIQELSFALCHVYAKATMSVSIPAPVYYADLACTRAALYFDPSLRFDQDDSTVDNRTSKQIRQDFDIDRWRIGFKHPSGNMASSMYFI